MRPPCPKLPALLLSLLLFLCSFRSLEAATHTWTGGGGNSFWSNATNWTGGKPTSNEAGGTYVVFGSGTGSVCDIAGLTVDQIHFTGGGNTLSGTTSLGLSGATVFVNILSDTGTNTIAANLPVILSGQNCFVDVVAGSLTLANNVSGTVGLRKRGAGTCTVTGNNSYTGPTSVVGGVLSLNSNGSNTAVPGSLVIGEQGNSGATVILQQGVEIADTATVTVYSDGTLNLNGKGETVGTLNVYGNVNLGGASGVLVVTTATNVFDPGLVTIGDGKFTQNGPLLMSGGTFQASATGLLTLGADVTATSSSVAGAAVNSPVKLAATRTLTVNAGAVQPELTFNGVIGEANLNTGLTKKGNGTLKLASNSSNTFTGTTTVESGTMQLLATSGRIVVGSLVIGNNNDPAGTAVVRDLIANNILNTAALTINHSGVLDLNGYSESGASLSGSGAILLPDSSSFAPAGSGVTVWTGTISGTGALRKRGTSSLTLKGTMPSTIGVYVEEGTLSLDLPPGSGPPPLAFVGDGGGAATSAVLRLASNNQLSSATKLTVLNDGLLDVNGTTTSIGLLGIVSGYINIGNGKLITTDTLTMNGGVISSGAQGSLALGAPVVATSSFAASASISAPLALEISPSITVNAGSVQPELILSGVIKDGSAGSRGFQKLGTGTLRCSGGTSNTFTGTAVVETGVLELNNSVGSVIPLALQIGNDIDPPGTAVVRNLVQLNLAAAAGVMIKSSGVFQLNNFGDRCDTLRGYGSVALGTARLTVGGSNGSSEFNGVISGTGGLTKNGTGTFTTTGNNPFSGTTQITGGLLLVNGIHGSSAVTVTAGALGGTGAAGPSVTAPAGGSVAPGGASPGSLLVSGPVNLSGGGRLAVRLNDVANPKSDQIQTTGNLNITGAVLAPIPSGPLSGNPYIVATYGSLTGTFLTSPPGTTINYAYNDGNSTNHIAITVTNPWLAWLAGYGLDPATTGSPSADPDKDGVPNAIEFVLGTDPTKPINPEDLPALSRSGSDIVFTFRRMASTAYLNPLPKASTDLNTWTNAAGTVSVAPNFYGPGIDRVTLTAPLSGNRRFYRLEVTIP